jgi:hypothetical protein
VGQLYDNKLLGSHRVIKKDIVAIQLITLEMLVFVWISELFTIELEIERHLERESSLFLIQASVLYSFRTEIIGAIDVSYFTDF